MVYIYLRLTILLKFASPPLLAGARRRGAEPGSCWTELGTSCSCQLHHQLGAVTRHQLLQR